MNTLFDHSGTRDTGLLTVIDGAPYILDTELVHIVPYSGPNAVRWAAKSRLKPEGPHGAALFRESFIAGSARKTMQAALTEAQAIFLARRAAIAYDKTAAVARISAAFAAWHAMQPTIVAGAPVGILMTGGKIVARTVPPTEAPSADLSAIIHAIGVENDGYATLKGDLGSERARFQIGVQG